jgi:hypothetical protein
MMRKIILGVFIFLSFAPIAHAEQNTDVILRQSITQAEADEFDIQIPENEPPGFKSLEVQISGIGKQSEFKTILFCKDLQGIIHWDNICADLTAVAAQTALETAVTRDDLPTYNPLSDSKQTTNTLIIAFAALSAVMGASALARKKREKPVADADDGAGYLAGVTSSGAVVSSAIVGRGDTSRFWNRPINQKIDRFVTNSGNQISGFSPLATRILADGNYQRSLIGPFSLLIYPVAIALGVVSSRSLNQQALPPSLMFILLMMTVGVIDAFAGILVSITFAFSVLVGGNLTSFDSVLTVLGVCLLAFSPTLLAGAFRPFRRDVWDFTSLWERGTDYLLASILTGWVVQQIVLGLPGLSGLQLPITIHARSIALWAAALVIIRFALEDISLRLFPQRLRNLEPKYRDRTTGQQIFTVIFKVATFSVVAAKYIGISPQLFLGVALFALPLLMGVFEDKFPKSAFVQKWMPTGIIELLVMTIGGYFLATLVADRYPSAGTYVLVSFVLLSIPGFLLKILALFGEEGPEDWKITQIGRVAYRFLGVAALAVLIYIVLSGLLISNKV